MVPTVDQMNMNKYVCMYVIYAPCFRSFTALYTQIC